MTGTATIPLLMLLLALILPWLSVLPATSPRLAPWVRRSLPAAPVVCLLLVFLPPGGHLELPGLLLGSQFGIDPVNRVFLAVTALAWLAASVLAGSFLRTAARPTRFTICFLLAMGGNIALVLSQDAISFFTGFAVMSLAAYGLVNHRGDAASTYAGRVYIVLAIAGEVLLFAALIAIVGEVGDSRFPLAFASPPPDWAVACAVLGFGIKAGLVSLHMSLPLAYGAAPLPGGVALAGAMLNAGLLGWLRWLPLGSLESGGWGIFFVAAGLAGAACGVVLGVLQKAPRALLGYSSVSQVGLMMLFIGAGLLAPDRWALYLPLLGYFMLHHAIAKTALFCASSGALPAAGPRWLWWSVLCLPALALIGVPFSSGYFAKAGLKQVVTSPGPGLEALAPWLVLATAGTTVLMARWLYLVVQASPGRERSDGAGPAAAWTALALAVVVVAGPVITPSFASLPLAPGDGLLATLWPMLVAGLLAYGTWHYRPGVLAGLVGRVPSGDIAGPVSTWLGGLLALLALARRPGSPGSPG